MRNRLLADMTLPLVMAIAVAAVFVLSTVAADELPDVVTVGASVLVAAALLAVTAGPRSLTSLVRADRYAVLAAAAAGALAFWAAPLIVMIQRATDAPPGAEVAFLTISAWGTLLVLASLGIRGLGPSVGTAAGALASLAGAAGLFANWERPSSFSPFIRYAERETWMLVAGVVFAVGVLVLAKVVDRLGATRTAVAAAAGGALAGLIGMVPLGSQLTTLSRPGLITCLYLGLAVAITVGTWTRSLSRMGPVRSSVGMLVVPAVLTSATLIERATAMLGPNPLVFSGLVAGGVVILAGAAVVWLSVPDTGVVGLVSRPALVAAVLAVALAVVALFTPALFAEAEGTIAVDFRTSWTMVGAESAVGWILLAGALLVLGAVVERAKLGTKSWVAQLVAAGACVAAAPLLASTPMHTWTTWIPADVQQAYGSEYARFAVSVIVDPVRVAAAIAVIVALVIAALFRPVQLKEEEVVS